MSATAPAAAEAADTVPYPVTIAARPVSEALAASRYFTDEEKTAMAYATMPLTAPERRELLHFLGWPEDLPAGHEARLLAVFERILETRGAPTIQPGQPTQTVAERNPR